MARWLVQLVSDASTRDALLYWFPDGYIFALVEQEQVYLTGKFFDKHTKASQVHEDAVQLLDKVSGAIILLSPNFRRPTVGNVIQEKDDGGRDITVFPMTTHLTIVGGHVRLNEPQGPTQAQLLLAASEKNRHLSAAIALWGDAPLGWVKLYLVLDEIEKILGKQIDKVFCTKNERNRFTQTANSAEAIGKEARHGLGRVRPHPNPMSLHEARRFIRGLLEQMLRQQI